jgi:hypothetical protein
MVSAVIDELRRYTPHEQLDDITLIVAKCRFDPSGDQMGLPYERSIWTASSSAESDISGEKRASGKFGPA